MIGLPEVDDWIVAFGLSRFLFTRRNARKVDDFGMWLTHVQATLAAAVNPKLAGI